MQTMHLFAGAGGGLLADLILGHRPIIAVEWDKYACKVLRARAADGWFPDLSVWEGDVRLFDPSEYAGKVDCIHAGFPCTNISTAGLQEGLGEGTSSGLYREVLRIVRVVNEIRSKLGLPAVVIFLENVSAITSNGLGTVLGDLASLGYDAEWTCLRASDCGATHERDRWWLLAHSNGARCEEGELPIRAQSEHARNSGSTWWQTVPNLPRVANGMAHQSHRLKAIGNGQVPLQAAVAYSILSEIFNAHISTDKQSRAI